MPNLEAPPPVCRDGLKPRAIAERWKRHAGGDSDERLLLFTGLAYSYHKKRMMGSALKTGLPEPVQSGTVR